MRRSSQSLAIFMASGILLGTCGFLSAGDETKVTEKEIGRLIGQLGSKQFKDREQATRELSKLASPRCQA